MLMVDHSSPGTPLSQFIQNATSKRWYQLQYIPASIDVSNTADYLLTLNTASHLRIYAATDNLNQQYMSGTLTAVTASVIPQTFD